MTDSAREMVRKQANDQGLWREAKTEAEEYLQLALRSLHEAVEVDPDIIYRRGVAAGRRSAADLISEDHRKLSKEAEQLREENERLRSWIGRKVERAEADEALLEKCVQEGYDELNDEMAKLQKEVDRLLKAIAYPCLKCGTIRLVPWEPVEDEDESEDVQFLRVYLERLASPECRTGSALILRVLVQIWDGWQEMQEDLASARAAAIHYDRRWRAAVSDHQRLEKKLEELSEPAEAGEESNG